MNPSLNPKIARLPKEQIQGKVGLAVGFSGNVYYRLATRPGKDTIKMSKEHGINPVMFKCWKCGKEEPEIGMPGRMIAFDIETQKVISVDAETPRFVESMAWCDACRDHHFNNLSKVICNNCHEIVACIESGTTADGFEVKEGMELHSPECPKCKPGLTQITILEMSCQPSSTSPTTNAPKAATSTEDPPAEKPV